MSRPARSPRLLTLALLAIALAGCRSTPRSGHYVPRADGDGMRRIGAITNEFFTAEIAAPARAFAETNQVSEFSKQAEEPYRLGPGDRFRFLVRGRPDITEENIVVSPDGEVALPRVGLLTVQGLTLAEVTQIARQRLESYYEQPDITLVMQEFSNNKVFVLGRVANPGAVHFKGPGTLLEALALAGGLPTDTARSFLTRCMIVRGRDQVIWIDLKDLLEKGNMALNPRLKNNDVVFIPQSEDQMAYVMGAVLTPGVLVLRSQMTLLDAVMASGGASRDANIDSIFLVRAAPDGSAVQTVSLNNMLREGDLARNYVLKDGDIVYVPESGMAKFNYFMTQLLPTLKVIDFTIQAAESFGAMQELRNDMWGQEGFVGRGSAQ